MSTTAPHVSASEISRLADVTRATVSNWRRRHADFPTPVAGSETRPMFDLREVQAWLDGHGVGSVQTPLNALRTYLRSAITPEDAANSIPLLTARRGLPAELRTYVTSAAEDAGMQAVLDVFAERGLEDGPTSGLYETPEPLARLMFGIAAEIAEPESVLDPACGSGTLLVAAAGHVKQVFGQDIVSVQAERARLAVQLSSEIEPTIRVGDSLRHDGFPGLEVDSVLCTPPFGIRDWGAEELALDARWEHGAPPRSESELAWVQHSLAHLHPLGTAVLLMPPAVAARSSGRKIRAALLRSGALRAVIELPPGAAQPRHIGLHLWILRRPTEGPFPDSVLFVDVSNSLSSSTGSGNQIDWKRVSSSVLDVWHRFNEGEGKVGDFASAVPVVSLFDEDVDLTPSRRVQSQPLATPLKVDAAFQSLERATNELAELARAFGTWLPSDGKPWRTATLDDLRAGSALQWFRILPRRADKVSDHVANFSDSPRVLMAPDVVTGRPPSGDIANVSVSEFVVVQEGDVLIPNVRSDRHAGVTPLVADAGLAGAIVGPHISVIRPDSTRLDAWFLAGFAGASTSSWLGTTVSRFDLSRVQVPLLPLIDQRKYGVAFQRLHALRVAARQAAAAADEARELAGAGLTACVLQPSDDNDDGHPDDRARTRGKR